MSNRNTIVRSMHDLGAAAWFGGALMGAIGVNGAAAAVREPRDRARVASVGWAKWSPVNAAAIAAHLVGGSAILYANRRRAKHQSGVTANTVTKIIATGAALGATAYSGALGAKTAQGDGKAVHGKSELAYDYRGARWLFSTDTRRQKFIKNPAVFSPQYDGYCAYGVSNGNLVPIDPLAFTVRGGKLYLNYSKDIQKRWLSDVQARIQKADEIFPTLAH